MPDASARRAHSSCSLYETTFLNQSVDAIYFRLWHHDEAECIAEFPNDDDVRVW